jgi:N-acetylglucosamine-6-sulfatase
MKSLQWICAVMVVSAATLHAVVPVRAKVVPERVPGAKPRNVVFILSDDHRYDAMSFMGHQFAQTPVMDSMAANGVHLKNALVTTSLCSPSRASMTKLLNLTHTTDMGRRRLGWPHAPSPG